MLRREGVPLLGSHDAQLGLDALYDIGLLLVCQPDLFVAIDFLLLALLLHILVFLFVLVGYLELLLPRHSNYRTPLGFGLLCSLISLLLEVLFKVAYYRLISSVLENELKPLLDLLGQLQNALRLLLRKVERED